MYFVGEAIRSDFLPIFGDFVVSEANFTEVKIGDDDPQTQHRLFEVL